MNSVLARIGLSREDVQRLSKKYGRRVKSNVVLPSDESHDSDSINDDIFSDRPIGGYQPETERAIIRNDWEGSRRF